jgi:hypothetical protein
MLLERGFTMRLFLTAALFLCGLFNLLLGLGFFFTPGSSGAQFNLLPNGAGGLAVLRADLTAFFVVAGACQLWGGWKRNGDLLLIPILLFAIAFTGRAVSAALDGTYAGFAVPMAVEAAQVLLGLAAWRLLPHHRIAELAG